MSSCGAGCGRDLETDRPDSPSAKPESEILGLKT